MTKIELKDVEAGDRVRLVNDNGDEATVTAGWARVSGVGSKSGNCFRSLDGWHVAEILPKPVILPTGENAMVAHRTDNSWSPFLRVGGFWHELDWHEFGGSVVDRCEDETVRYFIREKGFEVVFEGVQGDE